MIGTVVVATGLPNAFTGVVGLAGAVVLGLMLVALGAYAYKSVRGDGVEWPEDEETGEGDGLTRGDDDDEWDYY
jgi:hypothetical protein